MGKQEARALHLEKSRLFEELLTNKEVIQIFNVEGQGTDSLTVETDFPGTTNEKDRDLACVVPSGYIRYRYDSKTEHNGGGDNATVHWTNEDIHDGTIHLAVNCSGINGYAHAEVKAVYAIRSETALKLHQEALKKK